MSNASPKKSFQAKVKNSFIVFLIVSVICSAIYFYFWFTGIMKTNQQATQVVTKAQKFDDLKKEILSEQSHCKSFIAKGSGDFDQFTYCTRFIKWSEGLRF